MVTNGIYGWLDQQSLQKRMFAVHQCQQSNVLVCYIILKSIIPELTINLFKCMVN